MSEIIEITVDNKKNLLKLTSQLKKLSYIQNIKEKSSDTSQLAEISFSEEWNSQEDSRWDKYL